MTEKFCIRPATPDDAQALLDLYAPYVQQTAITFEYDVPSCAEFAERIKRILREYPYLVAECDGEPVGYAYAIPFHARTAYRWDVELSIYLSPRVQRQHLGTRLYRALLSLLEQQNVVTAYACITSPGGSIAFHDTLGFQKVGLFPRSGWKFESWHDIVWMERPLRQRVTAPEPFLPFPSLPADLVHRLLNEPV